jgi:hypothetical protein
MTEVQRKSWPGGRRPDGGFMVWGLGFGVWGLRFRVADPMEVLGFEV